MSASVLVLGAGLAGSEAAWQLAQAGIKVDLYEMRPGRSTSAHQTDKMAELVCSNSLKSEAENSAPWLLKQELRRLGCLLLDAANAARVPGGQALTVDRDLFADWVSRKIKTHPLITLHHEEVEAIPDSGIVIIATGPQYHRLARYPDRGVRPEHIEPDLRQ